jgi:hypothetical protein
LEREGRSTKLNDQIRKSDFGKLVLREIEDLVAFSRVHYLASGKKRYSTFGARLGKTDKASSDYPNLIF